jgi:hypothetical protein
LGLGSDIQTLHKTTRTEITSLFGETKLILDETPKAVSRKAQSVVTRTAYNWNLLTPSKTQTDKKQTPLFPAL